MAIIDVQNVSKTYRPRQAGGGSLAGLLNPFRRRPTGCVHALSDVSFSVEAGESFGIIGANGSGKSTLLKLLAGVTVPTSGHVAVEGRVASLLELGAGFHPWLTGRENIYLNGRIMGMSRGEIDAAFDAIVEFSGVGEFIDNPLDTFSSGMFVRLGFAVAVHANPDIFLVDEVLSVGDEAFQRKCRERIGLLRERGKTIVFVSHDLGIVNALCDRVILLSKGRLIARESPRETIDFYLRQVGDARGIHTLGAGAVEAILSGGRIALFHDKHEVSAPRGLLVRTLDMGVWHESTAADWEVVERGPAHCRARGRMTKLPVRHLWDLRIEDGRLIWRVAIECEHEAAIEAIEMNLFLPTAYARWHYGPRGGAFPAILPGDLTWAQLVTPDSACDTAAALPGDGSALPAVLIERRTERPHDRMIWWNTDYVVGARLLQTGGPIPDRERPFPPGIHELCTLVVDLGLAPDALVERLEAETARRTVSAGRLSAVFDRGCVRLAFAGADLTTLEHLYASLFVDGLWNDSASLEWDTPRRDGVRLEASGESRRFPYRQQWELEPRGDGIAVRIWIDVAEAFACQEYHTSICLKPDYDAWETPHESGPFPPIEPGQEDWRHANRSYAPGARIAASGPALPAVSIELDAVDGAPPCRMTAINTGFHDNARVLQALRVPETGAFRFEPGRHLLFAGIVKVAES
ncbi:MAG: ABC transporter ATP-binding protein [Candidatus Hydrogenedentes bacterium]|nr:ABC transporter ATP-binding protein [Candidatus Hydrogenedentota bacterium]